MVEETLTGIVSFMLKFGLIDRATLHEDGVQKETDTTHSTMVGVVGCAVGARLYPDLDLGLIAQFALGHDLPENGAGDTPAFGLTPAGKEDQKRRESAAIDKIIHDFDQLAWIGKIIRRYESQVDKEARFVMTIDKMLPKFTHFLNRGAAYRRDGLSREQVETFLLEQYDEMVSTYGREFRELTDMYRAFIDKLLARAFPQVP